MTQFSIRVASFNTLNLVTPEQDYYQRERYSVAAYKSKVRWSRHQLHRMMSDVVVFQEIFNMSALEDICKNIYPHILAPRTDENEPRIGMASLLELDSWKSFAKMNDGTPFRRPPLYACYNMPNGEKLGILGVHLKSRRPLFIDSESTHKAEDKITATARSLELRSREAQSIRRLAIDLANTHPLLIVGDFNSSPEAITTQMIIGPCGSNTEHHFRMARNTKLGQGPLNQPYSHLYKGRYEEIDLILCSDHFFQPESPIRLKHVRYFTDHLVDKSMGQQQNPLSQQQQKESPFSDMADMMEQASDHGQVVATFTSLLPHKHK